MAYCRVETADGYTVMSNYHLRDMRLSLKARGLGYGLLKKFHTIILKYNSALFYPSNE